MSTNPPGRHRQPATPDMPPQPVPTSVGARTESGGLPAHALQQVEPAGSTQSAQTATLVREKAVPPGQVTAGAPGHGHRHLGLALTLISAAQLMVVLDGTIVTIALPHIQPALHFTPTNLTWVVNGYTLAFGGLLLLGGRLGDVLGRRKLFMIGVLLFALASFFGGIAQNEPMMLIARAVQGVGAAIASPTALALITTTFPAGPARNRAFGVYAAMSGAGAAVGLILGGALTEWDWRWTFFINVPIGILVAVLAPRFLAESAPQPGRFDIGGAITGSAGLGLVVYGLTHSAQTSWGNGVTVASLAAGVLLLVAFVLIERSSRHALMPFRILTDRNRGTSFLVMLIVGAALFSMFYFLGLYIQQVLGYSAIKAGLAFLPFSFGLVFAAQVASLLVNRVDPRWISGAGGVIAAVGMFGFSRLRVDSTYAHDLLPWILTLSVGMGLTFVPMTLTAVAGVAKEDSGVGSAVLNTMQQVGGSLGLATLSTVAANAATTRGHALGAALQAKVASGQVTHTQAKAIQAQIALAAQTHGYTHAFLVSTGMLVLGALITLTLLNIRHRRLAADGVEPAAVAA